jgi:hypothetical protein
MSSNKKLCSCVNCLNKSNGRGRFIHNSNWNKHKKQTNINLELERDLYSNDEVSSDSNTNSSMSLDENTENTTEIYGILECFFINLRLVGLTTKLTFMIL